MLMATQHTATPTLRVRDNRGLSVRTLNYNRSDASQVAVALTEQQQASDDGRHRRQWDARLFDLWQDDTSVSPNIHARLSLAGQVLRNDSVDAGWRVAVYDAAGRVVWTEDGLGTHSSTEFDQLGRPQAAYLQVSGEAERVAERFFFGDTDSSTVDPAGDNARGQLVRYYHEAGLRAVPSYGLQGGALREQSQLLLSAEALGDWQGDNESAWQDELGEAYTTTHEYDAVGGALAQNDARGNRQRWSFDVAGQLSQTFLTLVGGSEQILLKQQSWSAAGQKLEELAGNDVVTKYSYEPQTQRLLRIETRRADQTVLQDLNYGYDPVGNVLWQENAAAKTRYFANQSVKARQEYQYDALYQLIGASGRENANANQQGPQLPEAMPDTNNLVNYTRSYEYDSGGNLLRIQHTGVQSYSNEMVVSDRSNRALAQNSDTPIAPEQVDGYFDANGNVLQMQPGTPLGWDGRNQLHQVVQVQRSTPQESDRELFQYQSGQRVRKHLRRLIDAASQRWDIEEVIYLPGLELRSRYAELGGQAQAPSEVLVVSTPAQGGRAQVLHWETGLPAGIANDQVRYGLCDQLGSLQVELDSSGQVMSQEEYYPFGGTAVLAARSEVEVSYKVVRYSGKERDGTGLYYYGYRYYAPWLGRWLNPDPAGQVDGLNVYRMVRNNPVTKSDKYGLSPGQETVDEKRQQATSLLQKSVADIKISQQQSNNAQNILSEAMKRGGTKKWATGKDITEGVGQFWTDFASGAKDVAQLNAKISGKGGTVEMTAGGNYLDNGIPYDILTGNNWNEGRKASLINRRGKLRELSRIRDPGYVINMVAITESIISEHHQIKSVDEMKSAERRRVNVGDPGAKYIWDMLSIDFAGSVSSAQLNIKVDAEPAPDKTWAAIEKPILIARGISIQEHRFQ